MSCCRWRIACLIGLQVNETAMQHNLGIYGPFAAIERVLMALGKAGADRQAMHERLRGHAMQAWEAVQAGKPNLLAAATWHRTPEIQLLTSAMKKSSA